MPGSRARRTERYRHPRSDYDPAERRAREDMIEWVHRLAPWSWFVTFTFSADVPRAVADEAFYAWRRRLAVELGDHFRYLRATDRQQMGRWHHHLLISLPPDRCLLDPAWAAQLWSELRRAGPGSARFPTGTSDCRRYDPNLDAAAYMIQRHSDIDIGTACPRTGDCRRGGCVHARSDR